LLTGKYLTVAECGRCSILFFTKHPRQAEHVKIGVQGTYTVWRCLVDRYLFIDHINHLRNFVHDQDFLIYLTEIVNDFKEETVALEELCKHYSIPSPEPSARDQNTGGNSEVVKDKETAIVVFLFLRMDLTTLLMGLRNSYSDDNVKEFLVQLAKKQIARLDRYAKYLKVKDWIQMPPLYPYTNPAIKEKLAVNEVHLLYDHLLFRYNNLHETNNFIALTSNTDFRAVLEIGTKILQKEIKTLEDKILYYGITLPSPYPINSPTTENQEFLQDRFMFDMVFRGMQGAVVLHGTAISEIIVNDELRKFFIDLTYEELFMLDKMDKYGKLKGWANVMPSYRGGSGG
jgi:hypothetical protein